MKIAIIGGGASGVLAAILIKKENIDHDVYIFEHENKLLKKLLATGNGRCNLGNAKIDINKYRNKDFAKNILKGYNVKQTFSSLGIEIKNIDNLYLFILSLIPFILIVKTVSPVTYLVVWFSTACYVLFILYAIFKGKTSKDTKHMTATELYLELRDEIYKQKQQ